ncbi:MAG: hypothetical protein J7K33_06840 [Candidatus Marinimicrobia bacterium]|nr:hypothetical protein [Candidatus Neomarinimicrobiota bacterium]
MQLNELSLLLLVPLVVGVVNVFLPLVLRKILSVACMVYLLVITFGIYNSMGLEVRFLNVGILGVDRLAFFSLAFIQIIGTLVLIFSFKGVVRDIEKRFFVLFPLTIAFSNGAVLSTHSIAFIIFWGLSGVVLYLYALLANTANAPSSAKKTFMIVGASDSVLILGLLLIWLLEPSKGFGLWDIRLQLEGQLAYLSFICLMVASFTKAGGFPFHTWIPDYCTDSPIESSALLPASLDKLLGIYLLARMVTLVYVMNTATSFLLMTLGALTIVIAVMMAMIQHDGRRLLSYHAVSQVGYMILGVGSGSIVGFLGGLFHTVNNSLYKTGLFLSLGAVNKKVNTCDLDRLGGLGRNMPLTLISALFCSFAISGIPPFNGFFSKWMIYQGMVEMSSNASRGYQIWLLVLLFMAVFGSALTLASFMKFLHSIFLGKRPKEYEHVKEAGFNQWISTLVIALICLVFGIFARELPLKYFLFPILGELGEKTPEFIGVYDPKVLTLLFLVPFLIGFVVYLLIKNVRFDNVYLGGMEPSDKFRIVGTEFYNEIREMQPLKSLYDWAEKKYFDIYDIGKGITLAITGFFRRIHSGQLQIYVLWIMIGLLILFYVVI